MDGIYHQQQKLLLCGLSAVNNLLQNEHYTSQQMNELADSLPNYQKSFFNYHSNFLKIGNYSADVLINALQQVGKQVVYFDKRQPNHLNSIVQDQNLLGFLLNKEEKKFFFTTHHWFSILKKNQNWYNLDGKLKKYTLFKNDENLIEFLNKELKNNLTIFIVYNNKKQIDTQMKENQQQQQQDTVQQENINQQQVVENQLQQLDVQLIDKKQQIDNENSLQNNQIIDTIQNGVLSIENSQNIDEISSVENTQQIINTQIIENTQKIENSQEIINVQSIENTQTLENIDSIENSQQIVNTQNMESCQKADNPVQIGNSQQIINIQSLENSLQSDNVQQKETKKEIDESQI
ncbi:unnamed protein product [Paramecium sonneborni]|uniref:ubiquitinyl hydrolase 1 n=1 Tax=Paramecium sonneborni TaxID=65129 RepID=A0A8S1MRF2_9CILI|nr:unnamed protein product [Paramecium sonneborni]